MHFFLSLLSVILGLQSWHCQANAQQIERIISLSPGTTELVASAGGLEKLVGVIEFSDFPAFAKSLPIVGNSSGLNIEKIIQLKPDLIVAWQGGNRLQDIEKLQSLSKQLDFKLMLFNAKTLEEIPNTINILEHIIHKTAYKASIVNQLKNQLNHQRSLYQNARPVSVFYQIWNSPLMTIGKDQFISQAIEICGGKNLFHDLKQPAAEIGLESIITRNPEVILLGGQSATQKDWLNTWQRWPLIDAVKHKHIYPLDADQLQRPTARLIQSLPVLCKTIDQARIPQK
ncbi:cobalamin-binding protein [Thiosulfativibrio zosterae]|uniref:Cobalamin-binding protein n=1 Tax=Thiosulfativibrio zosterae TaxID=2675053 RepID=A0A6F8PNE3_9GAMM|nr:cobalamin-binding protein [Thiosulfativibrio zosterae]BBP43629.1 cobalamin-binding protein [Thiosulfativibrio zosterae]